MTVLPRMASAGNRSGAAAFCRGNRRRRSSRTPPPTAAAAAMITGADIDTRLSDFASTVSPAKSTFYRTKINSSASNPRKLFSIGRLAAEIGTKKIFKKKRASKYNAFCRVETSDSDLRLDLGPITGIMYLLAVLLILAETQAISEAQEERKKKKSCAVFTNYQYVQFGSEVQVTCLSSCRPGTSYWTVNNQKVADRLSQSFNSSYAVLSLERFTYQSAVIQCHSSSSGLVLDGTTIKTYTKPSNVSCLLQATSTGGFPKMVCNWEHKMSSSLAITYIVNRTCDHCSYRKTGNCSSRITSCVFKDLPALSSNFSVIVRANSRTWAVDSDTYSFDPFHIWVLAPPEIQVTALVSHLLVSWNQTKAISNTINCQVQFIKQTVKDSMTHKEERVEVTIEGIESCVVYTVSARCASDGSPWSNWSPKQTVMSMLNPKTFKFNLWRKVVQQKSNGVREVKVMWTEIPQTCKEEYKHYVNTRRYTLVSASSNDMGSVCTPSSCFVSVAHEAHVIRLSIFQNKLSFANETVYVPAVGETLPQVSHILVSAHNGIIQASWQAPLQNVSGYIVDWTYDGNTYFWKRSNSTDTKLYDLEDFRLYNITVTPVFDDKTGHGKEAPQVCSRTRVPQAISISELQPKDTRADVRWDIEAKDKCSTTVAYFIVFYRQTDRDLLYNISVNCTQRNAVLEKLKPSTKYRVNVMAKGHTGNISSTERHFETQKQDPVLRLVLSICAAVVFLGLFILGVCCVWYKTILGKIVPNPGLSSLALWSSQSHQKVAPQYSQPSEDETIFVRVHPCESDGATDCLVVPPPRLGDDSNTELASDETERVGSTPDCSSSTAGEDSELATEEVELSADQADLATRDSRDDDEDTPLQEYLEVLPLSQSSPYHSQNAAPPPAPKSGKDCRRLAGKKHSSMYVSLDMFREGPDRG
ncbi:Granulocyte colony-stimulating factor receptor [Merluccius polli]|uniref:Granulocyte colony-stimulating factor receptor n=1 Tax=Merluccius polli TaxID=89951 RepID=A0AA47NXR5_MERPO|nr:Granulocyte colony-stimulating factor receptor [Merluccius polli]